MSKPASPRKVGDKEALSVGTQIRGSAQKLGLVAALIRGRKAGRSRWMGKRPLTRGVAKNPVDHPHGGGEGRTSGGRHPVTPWGKPTKGHRTRSNKSTDKMIIRSRHSTKRKG